MNKEKILAEAIAKDYIPKDNSKIIALKKLDNRAKLPATIFTYSFGIGASLLAGLGMSLSMGVIGGSDLWVVVGILLGVFGFICCGLNYPIYKRLLEKGKKKYAFEILELAKEISEKE